MEGIYTEKEVLTDALLAEKNATTVYNMGANECVHDGLRNTFMDILKKEHEIQVDVFNQMHAMGYYPTPAAEPAKIMDAKQKFQGSYKSC